ncbi:MAG: nitrous oxide reductase accessory protein NosL [Caldilineaceae bacterium]|nr:nitrous oxide reductase accessory protein NosL [Caldilineaceae bacterium]
MTRFLLFFVIMALVLAACGGGPSEPMPPEIRYGETMCAECGMIINEPKFASGFAYEESEGRYKSLAFDDIGEMLAYIRAQTEAQTPVGIWVHDYESEEWIDAETALYVMSDEIHSPMGHGIVAFATQEAAEGMANTVHATVLDWNKVRVEHAMMTQHGH